ncbi:unnamed protein product, partial [Mesorhabditis spiculigera]
MDVGTIVVLLLYMIWWLFMVGLQWTFDCADFSVHLNGSDAMLIPSNGCPPWKLPPGRKPAFTCIGLAVASFIALCFTLAPLGVWYMLVMDEWSHFCLITALFTLVGRLLSSMIRHFYMSAIGLAVFYCLLSLHIKFIPTLPEREHALRLH